MGTYGEFSFLMTLDRPDDEANTLHLEGCEEDSRFAWLAIGRRQTEMESADYRGFTLSASQCRLLGRQLILMADHIDGEVGNAP